MTSDAEQDRLAADVRMVSPICGEERESERRSKLIGKGAQESTRCERMSHATSTRCELTVDGPQRVLRMFGELKTVALGFSLRIGLPNRLVGL